MWIKQDIVNGQFLLAKGAISNLTGNWVFGCVFGKKEEESYYCIEVTPDGCMSHFNHEKGVLSPSHDYVNEITKFLTFYQHKDNRYLRTNIECFVITPDKSVNVIIRTDEVILPKLDASDDELKQISSALSKTQTPQSIEALERFDGEFDKKGLNTLLTTCYKVQSREYKAIRQALVELGIHLSFSKGKANLQDKIGDLFDIHAGFTTINLHGTLWGITVMLCNRI